MNLLLNKIVYSRNVSESVNLHFYRKAKKFIINNNQRKNV